MIFGRVTNRHLRKEASACKQLPQNELSRWKLLRLDYWLREPNFNQKLIVCLLERSLLLLLRRRRHDLAIASLEMIRRRSNRPFFRLCVQGLSSLLGPLWRAPKLTLQRGARSRGRRHFKSAPGLGYSFWFCKPLSRRGLLASRGERCANESPGNSITCPARSRDLSLEIANRHRHGKPVNSLWLASMIVSIRRAFRRRK